MSSILACSGAAIDFNPELIPKPLQGWQSLRCRWTEARAKRYYEALLTQNLFGEWEVQQVWGSQNSRHGGGRVVPVLSLADGLVHLATISKRRSNHGYELRAANIFQTN